MTEEDSLQAYWREGALGSRSRSVVAQERARRLVDGRWGLAMRTDVCRGAYAPNATQARRAVCRACR